MKEHFKRLAHYNAWANSKLSHGIKLVGQVGFETNEGAFFGSLQGTLNHLLVCDRLWLGRMTGQGAIHCSLDEIPCPAFSEFIEVRKAEDDKIIKYINELDEATLQLPLTYKSVLGTEFTCELSGVLTHIFNHQTHHRGQAHVLLTRLEQPSLELDFIYFLMEVET